MFLRHFDVYLGGYKRWSAGLNLEFVRNGKTNKKFSLTFGIRLGFGGQNSINVVIFCYFNVLAFPFAVITRKVLSAVLSFV